MKKFIVRGDIPKEPALIIKNQLLLAPGVWNGKKFTAEEIKKGISLTNWTDSQRRSIVYGHRVDGDPSPDQWLGYHSIPEYKEISNDFSIEGMYADLYLYDENLARKIAYGGAKAGVSERLQYRDSFDNIKIEGFINLSVVDNPACRIAYLNLSDEGDLHKAEILSPNFINLSDEGDGSMGTEISSISNSNIKDNGMDIDKEDKEDKEEQKIADSSENKLDDINNSNERRLSNKITEDLDVVKTENLSDENKSMEKVTENKTDNSIVDTKYQELESKVGELEKKLQEFSSKTLESYKPANVDSDNGNREPVINDSSKNVEITSSNKDVVNAIKEMNDNVTKVMTETIKANISNAIPNPQTVAKTNPNVDIQSRDDDVVTKLVKQFEEMHNIQNE